MFKHVTVNTVPTEDTRHPYEVYHATDILAMLYPDPQDWQINRDQHYHHVANVYAERDRIFALTNHTDGQNWTTRSEITLVAPEQSPRSTSVGDVIYSPETSRAWQISHQGLQEIGPS